MCQGLTNRLKFLGKTNRLTKLLILLIFTIWNKSVYFFDISDRNLIILWKFNQNYPSQRIDQFPLLRILFLYKDQQFVPISFVSIHAQCLLCLCEGRDQYNSLRNSLNLHSRSSVSNAWMHTLIYGSSFNLYSVDL